MAKQIIDARVRQKIDTLANWNNNNLKLLEGEQAFVQTSDGTPVNFKIGDGDKTFNELPFFQPPITLGSISASTPLAELNMLADGVWVARGSGTFPFGLVAEEGYYTTFRKDGTTWTLDSKTEVLFTAPDVTEINNRLDDHEVRIEDLEELTEMHGRYIYDNSVGIRSIDDRLNRLDDTKVNISEIYQELNSPNTQSLFNRRLYNYVVNRLASSTNFKTNTTNNVTTSFAINSANWGLEQDLNGVILRSLNNSTTLNNGVTWVGADGDNSAYVRKDKVGGVNNGKLWSISVASGTLPANYILPSNAETRTLPISVNGNYADDNGNITISGGGSGIIPPATASTLGGVKVGSGLSIEVDGTLSATGGGGATYTAGNGINISGTNVISVKVDGTTITTNASGQLVANAPTSNTETVRVALSALDTNLVAGVDLNGFIALENFTITDFKITAFPVPTGSGISVGIKKNGTIVTTTNSTIPANQNNSTTTTQPVFSSNSFTAGDRLNFFIPSGGVGSVDTGQNLIATIKILKS